MTKLLSSLLFLFFFSPVFINAAAFTTERFITREFPIASEGMLAVSNFAGNIEVVTGAPGVVKFQIVTQISSDDSTSVEKLLGFGNVHFQNDASKISATRSMLTIDDISFLKKTASSVTMHFYISVPTDIHLELKNNHGDIFIETANRNTVIDIQDGSLSMGDINADLSLRMTRSKGRISQIQDGFFKLSHSDLEMEDANDMVLQLDDAVFKAGSMETLEVQSTSSSVFVQSAGQAIYIGKEDEVEFETVGDIDLEGVSSNIVLKELNGESDFDLRHAELSIDYVLSGISGLNILGAYSNVQLRLNKIVSFTLTADLHHGQIQHDEIRVVENIEKKGRHFFKAKKGNGSPPIYIDMRYSKLNINFN